MEGLNYTRVFRDAVVGPICKVVEIRRSLDIVRLKSVGTTVTLNATLNNYTDHLGSLVLGG